MKAVIIAIGDEFLTGTTVDTNSAAVSSILRAHGIETVEQRTVGDTEEAIAEAVSEAARKADVVILTGGLGPTPDDLTRQALARALGVGLRLEPSLLRALEEFFASRGRAMTPANRIQAHLPEGASALRNPAGTAPGIAARVGRTRIFALPGVPHEMQRMLKEEVLVRLPPSGRVVRELTLRTFGKGESEVAALLGDLLSRSAQPKVAITASLGVISLRIHAESTSAVEAEAQLRRTARKIRQILGEIVFGEGDTTLAAAVGELLSARGQTLATAESCTGGLIGQLLTSMSGSSRYYRGGIVAYANDVKTSHLGVDPEVLSQHGAVSRECACAMACGVRYRLGADWGLSTTGIAGPTGGSPQKPVGLVWIGLAGPEGVKAFREHFPPGREVVRRRAALSALNRLRLALLRTPQRNEPKAGSTSEPAAPSL